MKHRTSEMPLWPAQQSRSLRKAFFYAVYPAPRSQFLEKVPDFTYLNFLEQSEVENQSSEPPESQCLNYLKK